MEQDISQFFSSFFFEEQTRASWKFNLKMFRAIWEDDDDDDGVANNVSRMQYT